MTVNPQRPVSSSQVRTTTKERAIELANDAMKQIAEAVAVGLPKIYSKNKNIAFSPAVDFLCDWFPGLPWDPSGMKIAANHILTNPQHLQAIRAFDAKFKLTGEDSVEQSLILNRDEDL